MHKSYFSGKHFVIMGATSGVGQSLCYDLDKLGASLLILGRNKEKLELMKNKLLNNPSTVAIDLLSLDIEEKMKNVIEQYVIEKEITGVAGGVYCSGIAPVIPAKMFSEKNIREQLVINYVGAMLFFKIMFRKSVRNTEKGTSVVAISSVRSLKGEKGLSVYGGTKAALVASIRSLAREIAPLKGRINGVSPGWIDTDMNDKNRILIPSLLEEMRQQHPLGLGSAEDVVSAILFLLSDESRWITGTNLIVDGGFLA